MARKAELVDRRSSAKHESFLRHHNYFYLKFAGAVCVVALGIYVFTHPAPRHNGGSWLGYTLGTISALLIVWLTMLGLRKRAITPGRWSLKGWTSAHVYLGLALVVLATLHTGFQFGLNVHTLAYALMMLVIVSGVFGVFFYATIPEKMSDNRAEKSAAQMLEEIAGLDNDLREAAQPLTEANALAVQSAIDRTKVGGGVWERLRSTHPGCATSAALATLQANARATPKARGGDEFGYSLFTDRDLTRALRWREDLPVTGAEVSGGGELRLPGAALPALFLAGTWLGDGAYGPFRLALGLAALSVVVLHLGVARWWGGWAGAVAAAVWALSPLLGATLLDLWNPSFLPLPVVVATVGCAGVSPVWLNRENGLDPADAASGGDRFDLASVGVDAARYVRVRDTGVNPAGATSSGFDLDAIAGLR
jgi:hypothetical protein